MTRKDFNIDEQERYYGRKFELISRIQDLRDLIAEIRAQEECAIKAGYGLYGNEYQYL